MRFTIVGAGSEREWLRRHMLRAEFAGVLRGDALADAYAQMDIFAFPSETDTAGNAVLEAMASGVPAVVMAPGGQRSSSSRPGRPRSLPRPCRRSLTASACWSRIGYGAKRWERRPVRRH